MLEFFRKYQRYFFFFITAVIIASFSFFGTFSTLSQEAKREDRIVAQAVDGSPLMLFEIQALARFISADREDAPQNGVLPNLCNNGVVRYDLLRTGLGDLLAEAYFDVLKEEFDGKLDRVKKFKAYVHPEAGFVSADAVWSQFLPAIKREMANLWEESSASPSTFSHLSRLYQQQSYLTPETLRRILMYQHQQIGLRIDPALQYGDLSLFGFHSLGDWFGRDFINIASEFILNAAALAEKKGFKVTLEEAKGDLICNFQASVQRLKQVDLSQSTLSLAQHLRSFGFDEKSAAESWRKVLLFRRYFQGTSAASFIDRLPFKDFLSYAREGAVVSQYRWPAPLRMKSFQDLVEFQTYISAVAPPLEDPLDIPSTYYLPDVVEEEYPELVQVSFRASVKEVSLPQAALKAKIKEVWNWQLDEQNWEILKKVFSFLPRGALREDRFQGLEKLSSAQRSQVDAFSRLRLLDEHPEWIEESLASVAETNQSISISQGSSSLPRIEKPWKLRGFLTRAASGDEEAKKTLLNYSDDGKTLYRIEAVSASSLPRILTFEDAKSQRLLSGLADRRLQAAYPKLRSKHSPKFQNKDGSWKPFSEVKGEVAKIVFSDVIEAIELSGGSPSIHEGVLQSLEAKSWTDEAYASHRLLPVSRLAIENLQKNSEDTRWIKKSMDLEDQFKFERNELTIQRTNQDGWMKELAFIMMPNDWSPIHAPQNGDISFFYLIDKKPCVDPVLDQISFGKELIAADAQLYLAEKLLESIFQNQSIVIPLEGVK